MKLAMKLFTGILMTGIIFTSCNSNEGKKQEGNTEIVQTEKNTVTYQLGDHIPNELVCMVNNAYMGTAQMPVPVEGKTYYGCCEMCVGRLNNDKSARIATDPVSGKPVDKAEAFIVLTNLDGRVTYFESKENFEIFKQAE